MTVWRQDSPRWGGAFIRARFCGLFCGLLGGLAVAAAPAAAQIADVKTPSIMPFDVGQDMPGDPVDLVDQASVYNFMWETFVALNWPQDQRRRAGRAEPDGSGDLAPWGGTGSPPPAVWQSYLRPGQVFVAPKDWPVKWDAPTEPAKCSNIDASGFLVISPNSTNYDDGNSDGMNQPFTQATYATGPIIDQNGNYLRFEVGLNQAYFTYVGHYRYYVPKRQEKAVRRFIAYVQDEQQAPPKEDNPKTPYFQPLPNGTEGYLQHLPDYALQGIAEWKAAWKILDGDDKPERFFRQTAVFLNPDGTCTQPVTAGLVGFHIHRVTPNFNHIGATFEQVDNTLLQPAYSAAAVAGAAELPAHASLNPGTTVAPVYDNGYQVCDSNGQNCEGGIGGNLPALVKDKTPLPSAPPIVNVARQVPIPDDVQAVNAEWRDRLKGKALFYYQLIGTQNRSLREPNPTLGPGTLGSQVSSTNNLINTTLESYTQAGWSCALCHQNATPLGVGLPLPPFGEAYEALRTISFLLQNAQHNGKPKD